MILGLTGGIASGKSTVASWFAELGASVVNADLLAREAVAPGTAALNELVAVFGGEILNKQGSLDRARLAGVVFEDPAARARLEAITHPAIAVLAEDRLAALRTKSPGLIVYEAPLLFEAGAEKRVDKVLLILVEPQVQLARVMDRDQLDAEAARARIAAQWPQADKVLRADYVIDNSGLPESTRKMVAALFNELCSGNSPIHQSP